MTKKITEMEFEQLVLKADKPVLVDFYADWCGPCSAMAPIIDEFAEEVSDTAYVYKMSVDECRSITKQLRIMSIPTFVAFKDGKAVHMAVGVQHKDSLKGMLA